jgi:hypothetical protein
MRKSWRSMERTIRSREQWVDRKTAVLSSGSIGLLITSTLAFVDSKRSWLCRVASGHSHSAPAMLAATAMMDGGSDGRKRS